MIRIHNSVTATPRCAPNSSSRSNSVSRRTPTASISWSGTKTISICACAIIAKQSATCTAGTAGRSCTLPIWWQRRLTHGLPITTRIGRSSTCFLPTRPRRSRRSGVQRLTVRRWGSRTKTASTFRTMPTSEYAKTLWSCTARSIRTSAGIFPKRTIRRSTPNSRAGAICTRHRGCRTISSCGVTASPYITTSFLFTISALIKHTISSTKTAACIISTTRRTVRPASRALRRCRSMCSRS